MRVALCALLLLSATALAQTRVGIIQHATGGGFVQVSENAIAFDLARYDFPVSPSPSYYPPVKGSPFDLLADGPTRGRWVLELQLSAPLTIKGTLETLPANRIEYRTVVQDPGRVQGCVGSPWTPIGAGTRVLVFDGPGACRLQVSLRIKATGTEAPGPYQGTLLWSLYRHQP